MSLLCKLVSGRPPTGADVQGFQMFLVVEQRDARGNQVTMHLPTQGIKSIMHSVRT